jgi:hypothetical protein
VSKPNSPGTRNSSQPCPSSSTATGPAPDEGTASARPHQPQFGGLKADDAKRLKDLEKENSTLKRLLADAELEKAALKEIARGNF